MPFAANMRHLALAAVVSAFLASSVHGQTLVIGVPAGAASLDPLHARSAADLEAARHIFETLITLGDGLQLEPGLAESWTAIDATTWELTLRRGVKFHDGSELTGEDVKLSLERARAAGAALLARVKEVSVSNPHTIRVVTDGPAPSLPHAFTRVFIVSRSAPPGAAIGSGPFRHASWAPNEDLVLDRFDQHWRGRPAWERVVRKALPNDAARAAELRAGQVALIAQPAPAEMLALEKDPKVKIVTADTPSLFALEFDLRQTSPELSPKDGTALLHNPFTDARVREAVDLAIDRLALAEVALEGLAKPANHVLMPGIGRDAAHGVPEPNVQRAQQLLAEAGYPNGFKAVLAFAPDLWPGGRAVGTSLARMIGRTGIAVEPRPQAAAALAAARLQGEHSLVLWSLDLRERSPEEALSALAHTRDRQRNLGSENWAGYANPELDRLLDEASVEMDDVKRAQLLEQAGALFVKERVALPLVRPSAVWALRKDEVDLVRPRADGATLAQDIVPAKR